MVLCVHPKLGVVGSPTSDNIGLRFRPVKAGREDVLNFPACAAAPRQMYIRWSEIGS